MGDLGEDASAVPRRFFASRGSPVLKVAEYLQRLADDVVRRTALGIRHEAETTGIVLLRWIV